MRGWCSEFQRATHPPLLRDLSGLFLMTMTQWNPLGLMTGITGMIEFFIALALHDNVDDNRNDRF